MKAMILAAGRGERMGNLTLDTPKPLLKVNGHALIEYQLDRLAKAGVQDCLINVFYLGEKIQLALGDGERYGLRIHYSVETEKLETAGGIIHALNFFEDQPFILLSADVWTDFPVDTLSLPEGKLAHLVLVNNPSHHLHGDFGLTEDGEVLLESDNRLTYANVGVYHPRLFHGFGEGFLKLRTVLEKGIKENSITGEHYAGIWRNIDTPERLASVVV
ncbi:MAG: N-acetylmuramate alpha-1-phosphate uridylyltransferase MurU [Gammaproteobacteria bacterium]